MSDTFNQILAVADWKEMTPRLQYFADNLIRGCIWRGLRVQAASGAKVCVEGLSADDFVQEAIERLINGRRHYNHQVTLEQNLKGIIRSTIWSLSKSSGRKKIIDHSKSDSEETSDAITELPGDSPGPDNAAMASESVADQKRLLSEFEASLAGENDLVKLVGAFKAEHYTPRSVEQFTGIPATRVSELKRKLRHRMEQFQTQAIQKG
jgi:DNA-directed RNA polymerase specialized sigma24 family protein